MLQEPLIFDSSALFNFGHRGNLEHLLERLQQDFQLLIPPIVEEEVSLKNPDFYGLLIDRFFVIREPNPDAKWGEFLAMFARDVGGGGELSVVGLALETSGTVVMDERAGREKAKEYGLAVTGTLGLLDYAITARWINEQEAIEIVKALCGAGFRIRPVMPEMNWRRYLESLEEKR